MYNAFLEILTGNMVTFEAYQVKVLGLIIVVVIKIFWASWQKDQVTCKGNKIRLTLNLSIATYKTRVR